MNSIAYIRQHILMLVVEKFKLSEEQLSNLALTFNENPQFGDLSLNAAFIIAGTLKSSPLSIAKEIADLLVSPMIDEYENKVALHIKSVDVAKNGFVNISLTQDTWQTAAHELAVHPTFCFKLFDDEPRRSYLLEFVSANPTGPLSLGHGRNAIIGDVLARVLAFFGHKVHREFYINDAGQQVSNLGAALKYKVYQLLGQPVPFAEIEYDNEYMATLAEKCVKEFGFDVKAKDDEFFRIYAKNYFLAQIKKDLEAYRVSFDSWVSEEDFHRSGKVTKVAQLLEERDCTYEAEGATWFRSTLFGDDKDRVLLRQGGAPTYIVPDIAYHKYKFDGGYDFVIDILGQDHHGYEGRLKAGVAALGYDPAKLNIIFYQLVHIREEDKIVRMSKRRGTFKSLSDVIETVGVDVARFFYLNKKADAHLAFDLELALTRGNENPVYYIQYAYVRTTGVLNKALSSPLLADYATKLLNKNLNEVDTLLVENYFGQDEIELLKKVCSLRYTLLAIASTYQTHLLANYTFELAKDFHGYYNGHKIVDEEDAPLSRSRLLLLSIVRNTLCLCLDLLGLSKPDRM